MVLAIARCVCACVCVCHNSGLHRNGWTDQSAVGRAVPWKHPALLCHMCKIRVLPSETFSKIVDLEKISPLHADRPKCYQQSSCVQCASTRVIEVDGQIFGV